MPGARQVRRGRWSPGRTPPTDPEPRRPSEPVAADGEASSLPQHRQHAPIERSEDGVARRRHGEVGKARHRQVENEGQRSGEPHGATRVHGKGSTPSGCACHRRLLLARALEPPRAAVHLSKEGLESFGHRVKANAQAAEDRELGVAGLDPRNRARETAPLPHPPGSNPCTREPGRNTWGSSAWKPPRDTSAERAGSRRPRDSGSRIERRIVLASRHATHGGTGLRTSSFPLGSRASLGPALLEPPDGIGGVVLPRTPRFLPGRRPWGFR